jgi:hypothetical protein
MNTDSNASAALIKDLVLVKNYFGENDKSVFEQFAFDVIKRAIAQLQPTPTEEPKNNLTGEEVEKLAEDKINSIALCFMENINCNGGTTWSQMLRLVDEIKSALGKASIQQQPK